MSINQKSIFLSGALETFPSLNKKTVMKKGVKCIVFTLSILVPEYEYIRKVKIKFKNGINDFPSVYVSGPSESKHRYPNNTLCMWYPGHDDSMKWKKSDGLLQLIGHIQLHLFRESYWREFKVWPGLEKKH